jgi:murein DD-endopeptidase MepM/ murein hydrolase activator NlpD
MSSSWTFPLKNHTLEIPVSSSNHPGSFAFPRKFYYFHTGVDLYAKEGDPVVAVESGFVVAIEDFTGEINGTPWWNDTWAVLVEGESGVVVYGEIQPTVFSGRMIEKGQVIGTVLTVLKELTVKENIPGHSRSMLHLELHQKGTTATSWWKSGEPTPKSLLDPTSLLQNSERT